MTITLEQSIGWRPDIGGWSRDILPFYDRMADELQDHARVIEVGVYHGRSIGYLAQALHARGKHGCTLVGVDSYRWHPDDLAETRKNLDSLPGTDRVMLVVAPSLLASRMLEPADLVFIDGFHDYEAVRADITAYRVLVRGGGMLSGHDYGEATHPGVRQAVDEAFPVGVTIEDSVWSIRL